MDKKSKLVLLNQVFSPSTPIQEKDFFFGRMSQLEKIIEAINEKWDNLKLGDFIPSPSLKYQDQLYGDEAAVS